VDDLILVVKEWLLLVHLCVKVLCIERQTLVIRSKNYPWLSGLYISTIKHICELLHVLSQLLVGVDITRNRWPNP